MDGGLNFNNISAGIDIAIPVNCIIYEKGSNGGVYIGTDIGVYYKNNTLSSWIPFFDNKLPHCIVTDLEINYSINKIRAGTYGRGIWQSPLYCPIDNDLTLTGTISQDQFIEVVKNIFSTENISGGHSIYRAGSSIELNLGFEIIASNSSNFYGYIHACNHPGNSFRKNNVLAPNLQLPLNYLSSEIKPIIYPNPNHGIFTVDLNYEPFGPISITVTDMTGRIIWTAENINHENTLINLENKQSGIYIIKINIDNKISFSKISLI